jgi:hypothetical protein
VGVYRAVAEELVLDELDGGLVVYDTRAHRAHWLEPSAAAVWRACGAGTDSSEIAAAAELDLTTCLATLDQLIDIGLVEILGGVSRRSMLASAAKVGAAGTLAAPIISAVIPVAAAHASTRGSGSGTPPTPTTFTLKSGPGAPASVDPNNLATIWDPSTSSWASSWSPAYNYRLQGGYGLIPTTGWISYYDDPNGYGPGGALTSIDPSSVFYIPAGAQDAQISGQFLADDFGTVYVNGNLVATTPNPGYTTPTTFTAQLIPGTNNWLSFQMTNSGSSPNPTGVDYLATVSYT